MSVFSGDLQVPGRPLRGEPVDVERRLERVKKDIDVAGKLIGVDALHARDMDVVVTGRLIKLARIDGDGYVDVKNPPQLVADIKRSTLRADIVSFVELVPNGKPKYPYRVECESIAVLPITTFDHWWQKQIPQETRTGVRKAEKKGVVVKVADYSDEFVKGIQSIYDESPIRQGKPFVHYRRSFEALKKVHGTFLETSDFIAAYYDTELIGFMKLIYAKDCAGTVNIISKIAHRDKRVNNALIAKAVEICAKRGIPYLTYCSWSKAGLGEFKIRNGFQKMDVPRYYIPLTIKGRVAVSLKLYRGIKQLVPETLKDRLVDLRARWYSANWLTRVSARGPRLDDDSQSAAGHVCAE